MTTKTIQQTARIIEIFSSIQGEGIYAGQPHLFVRFWDCNMKCHYCDTDYRGKYQEMPLSELEGRVAQLLAAEGPHEAVSLTGGEPLLWWRFLTGFLPRLKALDQRVYLETNGTLPKALAEVLQWVDVIAMDVKPISATLDRDYRKQHAEFLEVALNAPNPVELFVKIVVTPETKDEELGECFELVSSAGKHTPVILQPVTPHGPVTLRPSAEQLRRWLQQGRRHLYDVRILPQIHPMLGLR
ncbi:MAG: 7-carboxy-7-deazaguanine synthase QueE [Candidatus Omnitrophica bacterium]|nr:7-carboxy-7-deazaguanine synthase QueE [Candidatus Omnitrophota bacterium]